MAGIVRAHVAAKETGLQLLVGSQFRVGSDGDGQMVSEAEVEVELELEGRARGNPPFTLTLLACNLNGYGNLCEFITRLRRSSDKGCYRLTQEDVEGIEGVNGADLLDCVALVSPSRDCTPAQLLTLGRWSLRHFTGRCWFDVELPRLLGDQMWPHRMSKASSLTAIPLVALGDVHMHLRSRRPLQDVLTAIRVGKPLSECGFALQSNAERHLRSRPRLAQTYPPALLAETLRVASRCAFTLEELKYRYPQEVVPEGEAPGAYLRRMTYEGAGRRWPNGIQARSSFRSSTNSRSSESCATSTTS